MEKLDVLYQANDKYAPYAGVSILSLLQNNQAFEEITVYLLDDEISKENLKKIQETVGEYDRKLVVLDTEPVYRLLDEAKAPKFRDSYTTYYKLFVLDQLEPDVDRLLYIDCDAIVCGNLYDLKNFDFQGNAFAMAISIYHNDYRKLVGFGEDDIAYNAGIMYFDLKAWKAANCTNRLIQGTENLQMLRFAPDQTLSILVLKENLTSIDLKYNFNTIYSLHSQKDIYRIYESKDAMYYSQEDIDRAFEDVRIYHFITLQTGKPWEKGNIHPQKELWNQYFSQSKWKDMEEIKVKRTFVEKMQRFLYRYFPSSVYIWAHKFAWKYLMKNS